MSLFANLNKNTTEYKAYDTSESFLSKYFQKRFFRCGIGPYTPALFFLSAVSFINRVISYFYSNYSKRFFRICDWPVGQSFVGLYCA